ncbi:unnamed protein product [Amoebophrya sp. A120]|nr:unnamed protein product [Amoebophrya sp. A120]|eukprot:GSA120T00002545001.1
MRFDYLSLHPEQVDDANKGENSIPFELSLSSRFSFPGQYNQVTVNEYPAGVGIAPHVETHSCFEEGFCSVSLLGGIVMDFRRRKDTFGLDERQMANVETLPNNAEEEVVSLYLPPRSRVTFHGEARFAWRHGIASRTSDMVNGVVIPERQYRISLTYRKVKSIPFCDCPYVWLCNHQNPGSMQLPKRKLAAAALARQAADEV